MIQRIQSVLLLLAGLVNIALLWVPFWKYTDKEFTEQINALGAKVLGQATSDQTVQSFTDNPVHLAVLLLTLAVSAFLSVIILQFNNRMLQMRMCTIGIILLMAQTALLGFFTAQGPLLIDTTEPGAPQLGLAFPIIALILTYIAGRRIKADEEMVRSADRIR
ncbi:MAG: DUF4293 domain-containing protein [Bacteroidota bacterium]